MTIAMPAWLDRAVDEEQRQICYHHSSYITNSDESCTKGHLPENLHYVKSDIGQFLIDTHRKCIVIKRKD